MHICLFGSGMVYNQPNLILHIHLDISIKHQLSVCETMLMKNIHIAPITIQGSRGYICILVSCLYALVICHGDIGIRGGGCSPPPPPHIAPDFFKKLFFGGKHVIFGQSHLIFGQAMKKIFGQHYWPQPPKRNWSRMPMHGDNRTTYLREWLYCIEFNLIIELLFKYSMFKLCNVHCSRLRQCVQKPAELDSMWEGRLSKGFW